MSEFSAYVQRRLAFDGYRVYLVERMGPGSYLHTHDRRRVALTEAAVPDDGDYFCDLPPGAAHALLGALARELGAVEHPEQLRKDFEQVRSRYDKVVDYLMTRTQR